MGSLKMTELPDRKMLEQIYLHGDGLILDVGLKNLVETGICCLFLFQHNATFTARFELLGVKGRLQILRRNSARLVKKST
jgi:hypothetical protein